MLTVHRTKPIPSNVTPVYDWVITPNWGHVHILGMKDGTHTLILWPKIGAYEIWVNYRAVYRYEYEEGLEPEQEKMISDLIADYQHWLLTREIEQSC